jgi:hypothetical protein
MLADVGSHKKNLGGSENKINAMQVSIRRRQDHALLAGNWRFSLSIQDVEANCSTVHCLLLADVTHPNFFLSLSI